MLSPAATLTLLKTFEKLTFPLLSVVMLKLPK